MMEKKKRATPWKPGKVISIRLRNGVYVLAQMVRDPYLVFSTILTRKIIGRE